MPATVTDEQLKEAKATLDVLKKATLIELRGFKKPPEAVKTVCEACQILLKGVGKGKSSKKTRTWQEVRQWLRVRER